MSVGILLKSNFQRKKKTSKIVNVSSNECLLFVDNSDFDKYLFSSVNVTVSESRFSEEVLVNFFLQ
jgi:hypothetical protein